MILNPVLARGGSWTKLGETTLTVNTTSTTAGSAGQLTLSEAWTKAKIIYVRIRDTQGKRNGYFYGSDTFYENYVAANGATQALTAAGRLIHRYNNDAYTSYSGSYGVYGYDLNTSGRLRIYRRYSSTYSLTINSTYKVEVYALDYPDGVSPFN